MNSTSHHVADVGQMAIRVVNLAAYRFAPLNDLTTWRQKIKLHCLQIALKGTILLSPEGINLFVAGEESSVESLMAMLQTIPGLEALEAKRSHTDYQPFHRMLVKIKREIIAFGIDSVRPSIKTSPKLKPEELKRWLSEGHEVSLLDVRNDYEVELGTFKNAMHLGIHHFREFPNAISALPEELRQRPVVMFCTGGIRCEKAGPWMESLGFEQIYQLDGGILKYFEECGSDHYQGECFVFDQRVAVDATLQPTDSAMCFACQATLTLDDRMDPRYVPGESCPKCFRDPRQVHADHMAFRQAKIIEAAEKQPGCIPYEHTRLIHVTRRLAGSKLIDFLDQWHPGYSRERWMEELNSERIRTGRWSSESVPAREDQIVREGERFFHVLPQTQEPPIATSIQLLFEDHDMIVVSKPAPMPVHASGRYCRNTLEYILEEVYRPEKLRFPHRLDANTSGVIVVARKHRAARQLNRQFATQAVDKTYWALVFGHPSQDHFECDQPICSVPDQGGSRRIAHDVLNPAIEQHALTRFRVLKRLGDGTSLVEATPVTGRTNQIRLHLWHLGHSIVNDPMYLPNGQMGNQQTLDVHAPSMRLHSYRIAFAHPIHQEAVHFIAQVPPGWAVNYE